MHLKAFITGSAGPVLTDEEIAFFKREKPCGFILFVRNCETPSQVKALIHSVRDAIGTDDILVLVDQEGGRVARLRSPQWPVFPRARNFGILYEQDKSEGLEAARMASQWLAASLLELGINVNCVPVLDVPAPGAHDIIGDRAYSEDPETIIALGRAVMQGHLDAGVLPVIKHIPGHGRAGADSHESLPVIETDLQTLRDVDFKTFKALNDAPLGMTGHLLIPALDDKEPVSTSPHIIADIIRGEIGFDGLLMSDDLSMGALSGEMTTRTEGVLKAGCDVALHCNGHFDEMEVVAACSPVLEGAALRRFQQAIAALQKPQDFDRDYAQSLVQNVLALG